MKNICIFFWIWDIANIILTDLNSGGSCHLRSRPRGGLRCDVAQRQFDDQTLQSLLVARGRGAHAAALVVTLQGQGMTPHNI